MSKKAIIKQVDNTKKEVIEQESVPEKPDFRKYLNAYVFDITLPSGIKLQVRPINAGQLKTFVTSIKDDTIQEVSRAMYALLQTSIIDYDLGEIYLNDRAALILELRKLSKGSTFESTYNCQFCKSQSMIVFDLDDIKITPMPDKVNPIVELDDNLSCQMDFVKIKDEQEIFNLGLKSEPELLLSVIAVSIKSIMTPEGDQDDLSVQDKIYFTDNIPQQLYEKLTDWHEQYTFGIDMSQKVICKHCKKESDFTLDADNFFF